MNAKLAMNVPNDDGRVRFRYESEGESVAFEFGFSVKLRGEAELTERDFTLIGSSRPRATEEAELYLVNYGNSKLKVTLAIELFEGVAMAEWAMRLENLSGSAIEIESATVGEGVLTSRNFREVNGRWKALNVGLQSTDMHVGIESLAHGRQHYFDSMTVLHEDRDSRNVLLGFVSFETCFSQVLVEAGANNDSFEIRLSNSMDRMVLPPGASATTEKAIFLAGERDHERLLSRYMDRVCREMKPVSAFDRPATGWLSWYYYYGNVTEKDILDNARGMQEISGIRPEYVVVDSGWFLETGFGDWEANRKFPSGMKALADKIKDAGFKPGLWFSPLLADAGSLLVRNHPDWLLRKEGIPVAGMNPNGSDVLELHEKNNVKFVLDLTHPEVLAYLRGLFRRVVHEWGYRYIKLDFLVRSLFTDQGNHSSVDREQIFFPNATTVRAYRNAMKVIREAAGEDCYILGCAAPLFASMGGLIDANRMTPDITRRNYVPDRIRPTAWELVKICSKTMAARYFLNGRAGFNDPDVLVVRGHEPEGISDDYTPTVDEARVWAGVVALSGGLLFYNDQLATLEEDRKPILKQLFPVGPEAAIPVDFFNEDAPAIWKLALERDGERWTLLGVFNWGETVADLALDLTELGFEEGQAVHGFEFWSQSYAEGGTDSLLLKEVSPHSMRLIALRPVTEDRPQLIGTDLHFTQGWAEFESVAWEDRTLTMRWRNEYRQRGQVRVCVPQDCLSSPMESNGKIVERSGRILTLSQEEAADTLWVRFEG